MISGNLDAGDVLWKNDGVRKMKKPKWVYSEAWKKFMWEAIGMGMNELSGNGMLHYGMQALTWKNKFSENLTKTGVN